MEKKNQEDNFIISIVDGYVKEISGHWASVFTIGLLIVVFGLIFLVWPEKALVFIAYIIGLSALIIGIWVLGLSMKIKRIEKKYHEMKENLKSKFFD
jgi:uncharacterized membrane protein HdeD (DUF308 family)